MKIAAAILASTALLVTLPAPACAQQMSEVAQHMPEFYGTFHCGPLTFQFDASWKPSALLWDGAHYYAAKAFGRDIYVLGFPDYVATGGNKQSYADLIKLFRLRVLPHGADYVCDRVG